MTSIEKCLEEMKDIETDLLVFLEEGEEDNFDQIKIHENQYTLTSFFHLLTKIADNHHHGPNFF